MTGGTGTLIHAVFFGRLRAPPVSVPSFLRVPCTFASLPSCGEVVVAALPRGLNRLSVGREARKVGAGGAQQVWLGARPVKEVPTRGMCDREVPC